VDPEHRLVRAVLGTAGAAAALMVVAAPATSHQPVAAQGGEAILERATARQTADVRRRFFGARNIDSRTGRPRRDRLILSWFGVSNFAMAIRGKVVLLDAWVPRGAHSGYVPTAPAELAALRPRLILIGHAHFDHAADAVPIALASGATLVGTGEHCAELRERAPAAPPHCLAAIPNGAPLGTAKKVRALNGVKVRAVKHLHSTGTSPDGYHMPVAPLPATTMLENPPTPADMLHLFGHLPDSEGGSVAYRFQASGVSLVWHDTAGPLVQQLPRVLDDLRQLRPVDVQVGAIQGFNQLNNGMRDPRKYIEALRPETFVPSHHDDWAAIITTRGERYRPYLEAELAKLPDARRPRVRFISDPRDYVRPSALTFRLR
jgi:L-ascorbate metabolism protein UlaG (beta-lactamase superfamily)